MDASAISATLAEIRREQDQNRRNLLAARLVSEAFAAAGAQPVVVGGSAVEFYTEGKYVSGDVDVCFVPGAAGLPTPRSRETVMSQIGSPLTLRKWDVGGVLVDVLGAVETEARTPFQRVGTVRLIQIEDLIAERILIATYPQRSEERVAVARTLLAVAVAGLVSWDREELLRVADSPAYDVGEEVRRWIAELGPESPTGAAIS